MNQVAKYLSRYAEPEARRSDFNNQVPSQFDHVLVIPAYSETIADVTRTWQSLESNFLVIVVVNSAEADEATEQLAQDLAKESLSNVIVIDRFSERRRIPPRQGVGLARKVGCDIALSMIDAGVIRDHWIFTTDADVTLPADYFKIPKSVTEESAAAVFPFRHVAEPEYADACQAYELSMLYYAAGIHWAGSNYGYTTIGSTMAFSANHYAGVRGFPKRNTGEDFYLLNNSYITITKLCELSQNVIANRLSREFLKYYSYFLNQKLVKLDLIRGNIETLLQKCFAVSYLVAELFKCLQKNLKFNSKVLKERLMVFLVIGIKYLITPPSKREYSFSFNYTNCFLLLYFFFCIEVIDMTR